MKRLDTVCLAVLKFFSLAIMLFLTYYAFFYTQDILPVAAELAVDYKDSPILNIAVCLIVGAAFVFLSKKEDKWSDRTKKAVDYALLAFAVITVTVVSVWWTFCEKRVPQADQLYTLVGASHLLEGDYSVLDKGGYFGLYPHQLGLAFIMTIIFRFSGPYEYAAFQWVNVFYTAGIVIAGFILLKLMNSRVVTRTFYCFFMVLCIPLIGYTHWVYGEIPSLFFMLAALIVTIKFDENRKIVYAVVAVVCTAIACLYRGNSFIFVIAYAIGVSIHSLVRKQYKMLILAAAVVLCSVLANSGVSAYYEKVSGRRFDNAMPTSAWYNLSVTDRPDVGPGWDWNVAGKYAEYGYDAKTFDVVMREDADRKLQAMIDDPGYGMDFVKRKILSQWNEPLFESVFFSTRFANEYTRQSRLFSFLAYGDGYKVLLFLADRVQSICFLGVLLYCVFGIKKGNSYLNYIIIITLVGGFLFSILWEAKARYNFPYYVMMFPMFCMGLECTVKAVSADIKFKFSRDKVQDKDE